MTHPADPCFALDTHSTMVTHQRDPSAPPIGLIEGFFGKSWSWQHRIDYANWLRQHGYDFYLYAPKDDGYLRRHWQLPWPAAQQEQLKTLASSYRAAGLAFGVGLTPLGAHHDYPKQRDALLAKVKLIDVENLLRSGRTADARVLLAALGEDAAFGQAPSLAAQLLLLRARSDRLQGQFEAAGQLLAEARSKAATNKEIIAEVDVEQGYLALATGDRIGAVEA